jgi:hypothetical protein
MTKTKKAVNQSLRSQTIDTPNGDTMTLASYLREGMTLVCYSEII